MSLIPLGIIGAVIGHWVVGIPVSILSFLGIVALAGIIINDSVVLVDKYNRLIREGNDVSEALYEAGMARFRPIVLTTITTTTLIDAESFENAFPPTNWTATGNWAQEDDEAGIQQELLLWAGR